MRERNNKEAQVRACYAGWSRTYYADYYGKASAYPPLHRNLVRRLLLQAKGRNVLDAGCGPASFLRSLVGRGIDLYGFDLTSEMVIEARRILGRKGVPSSHLWEGSVLSPASFRFPRRRSARFDSAVCLGVFPHIEEPQDATVIENMHDAVKRDGLVIIEARNQLFALSTLNRYSYHFLMNELFRGDALTRTARRNNHRVGRRVAQAVDLLKGHFRMDVPPIRKGSEKAPGYDQVLSRVHNPLLMKEQFISAGFKDVRLLFYHFHCLPPMFESRFPEFFRRTSLAMENPEDWRGHFLASAFLLAGRRA